MKTIFENQFIEVKVAQEDIDNTCGLFIHRKDNCDVGYIHLGLRYNKIIFWLSKKSHRPECTVLQGESIFVDGIEQSKE